MPDGEMVTCGAGCNSGRVPCEHGSNYGCSHEGCSGGTQCGTCSGDGSVFRPYGN